MSEFQATPYIDKLKQKLRRQTEAVIETQSHINALEDIIKAKVAKVPNPIKT